MQSILKMSAAKGRMMNEMKIVFTVIMIMIGLLTTAFPGQASDKGTTAETMNLSIHQAIELALAHAPDIRQAELNLHLAELKLQAARASAYLPTIGLSIQPPTFSSGTGIATDIQGSLAAGLSLPWGTDLSAGLRWNLDWTTGKTSVSSWSISLSQQLDLSQADSGADELGEKEASVASARLAWQRAKEELVVDVIDQFSELLTEKAKLQDDQADLQAAQDELAQAKKQVQAGKMGKLSQLEAELALLEAQIALKKEQNRYASAKEAFGRTLGIDRDYEPSSPEIPIDRLLAAANELLRTPIPASAIDASSEVRSAQAALNEAKSALQTVQRSALPTLSLNAGVSDEGWKIGVGIAFDLLDPARGTEVRIARAAVELANQKLISAREQARNDILDQRACLQEAVDEIAQLKLEEKKWALEETVDRAKLAAGLLSPVEWREFNSEKQGFHRTEAEAKLSLLAAYLRYRARLGLKLDWEEWLP